MVTPLYGEKILQLLQTLLSDSLIAVYLHGSAITTGLRPKSDIDLIAVVNRPLTDKERIALLKELLLISNNPGDTTRRPVELILFLQSDFAEASYPHRCEFLYGEWLRSEFEAGTIPEPHYDPELTIILAQARLEAQSLMGPPTQEIFPDIPMSDICHAMKDLLPSLINSLEEDTCNVLLTLARMWHTLEKGTFVSKDTAAQWAISRMPPQEASVLSEARDSYLGLLEDHWNLQEQDFQDAALLLSASVKKLLVSVDSHHS